MYGEKSALVAALVHFINIIREEYFSNKYFI